MSKVKRLPERSRVKTDDTWDLSSLYADDQAWQKDLAKLKRQTKQFETFRDFPPITVDQLAGGMYRTVRRLFDTGKTGAGLALVEWMADTDTNAGRAAEQLARAHAQFGDRDRAITYFEQALTERPGDLGLQQRLAAVRAYRRGG